MSTNDHKWLDLAIEQAKKAEALGEVPVGAVLVSRDSDLIASAYNEPIRSHNATSHAEVEVIKKAGSVLKNYRLPNTTLYTTLEPCVMCTGAIVHARISRVVFATRDVRSGACGSVFSLHENQHLNHTMTVDFIERKECLLQLQNFFKARR